MFNNDLDASHCLYITVFKLLLPGLGSVVNFILLSVNADLTQKVVTSDKVSVVNFQFDQRTLATHSTTTPCTAFRIA